jgi:hypothetical protein
MATIEDLELQVRKLKKQVRQLTPKASQDEVSDLVGDGTNLRMNPTRSAFSDAVGKAKEEKLAEKEAKAQARLKGWQSSPDGWEQFGARRPRKTVSGSKLR